MDLEDEFMDLLNAPTMSSGITVTQSKVESNTEKTLEEELFDLLNTPGHHSKSSGSERDANAAQSTEAHAGLDNDLLSWLEESPSKPLTSVSTVSDTQQAQTSPDSADRLIYSENASVVSPPPAPSSFSLLDDEEEEPEPVMTLTDNNASSTPLAVTTEQVSPHQITESLFADVFGGSHTITHGLVEALDRPAVLKTLPEQIEDIISSPFPDIGKLRLLIDEEEYIPQSLRAQVLLLLLTGSCAVDEEAQKYSANEADSRHYAQLTDDCTALLHSCSPQAKEGSISEDMRDIVVLYCQRRSAEYQNVYSRVLLSVFGERGTVGKAAASSCFYALCSSFLPISGLQHTPRQHCMEKIHSWLRLLVTYHSPALAQHLDRLVPGWEKPAKELSSAQIARYGSILKGSAGLDLLEKELGVDLDIELDNEQNQDLSEKHKTTKDSEESQTTRENRKYRLVGSGLVPAHWYMSFFAGCLPADESTKLLDWAVFNGERFAGVYFIAALLELHAEYLLQCNAASITSWFERVAMNGAQWFQNCLSAQNESLSWPTFTRGWIHATAALMAATPKAVRDALNLTESWAIHQTEREAKSITQHIQATIAKDKKERSFADFLNDGDELSAQEDMFNEDVDENQHHQEENTNGEGNGENTMRVADGEELDKNETTTNSVDSSALSESLFQTALGKLRTIGSKLQTNKDITNDANELEDDLPFVHSRKTAANTVSLWTEPSEVIPSICSNQRHTSDTPLTVCGSFSHSVQRYVSGEGAIVGTCFFLNKICDASLPVFFAIDCRAPEERALGTFPKSYVLHTVVDENTSVGESVAENTLAELVNVLEPLASTVHFVLIGAGDKYFSWFVGERARRFTNATTEAQKLAKESEKRINTVAAFLIQRNFRHVSILDGGFYAATKFLFRPESRQSIRTALVDADMAALLSLHRVPYAAGSVPESPLLSAESASVAKEVGTAALKTVSNFLSSWNNNNNKAAESAQSSVSSSSSAAASVAVPAAAAAAGSGLSAASSTPSSPAPAATTTSTAASVLESNRAVLGMWGSKLMTSLETMKKNLSTPAPAAAAAAAAEPTTQPTRVAAPAQQTSFVIDGEEEENNDDTKISIVKTESERSQALAIHRMAGLRKGDSVVISRAELPGAILFPCVKSKAVWVPETEVEEAVSGEDAAVPPREIKEIDGVRCVQQTTVVSRYLVVSRERLIVLDANGGGVGSLATVKSNHHLTELIKMTFKKKDPELVTLHLFASDEQTRTKSYRVAKYRDFVTTLQKHMERFK